MYTIAKHGSVRIAKVLPIIDTCILGYDKQNSSFLCFWLPQVVQSLQRYEVQRQEYIRELVYTERTHLHNLKIMKFVSELTFSLSHAHPHILLFNSLSGLQDTDDQGVNSSYKTSGAALLWSGRTHPLP